MKSIYSNISTSLSGLSDTDISNPQQGQLLEYINGKWKNMSASGVGAVQSVFGRTAAVVAQEGDYILNQLGDVSISLPQNNQILKYDSSQNGGLGGWINSNTTGLTSFNGRTNTNVVPTTGDYSINQISGININTPTSGQLLEYNGSNWVNFTPNYLTSAPVNSVFGRTNIITAQKNDYSLNLLSDVSVSSSLTNQVLKYNGSNFINTYLQDNTYEVDTSCNAGATVNCVINKTYFCNLGTLNIPNSSTGACIKIINANGPVLNIVFSGLLYINNTFIFAATLTTTEFMYMELKNYLGTAWIVSNLTPRIYYPAQSKYLYYFTSATSFNSRTGDIVPTEGDYNLNLLGDVTLNNNLDKQVLKFDGISNIWYNERVKIDELLGTSITSSLTNQVLKYNGANYVNSFLLDNTYDISFDVNSGATVNAVNNRTYFCNLGTLIVGNSTSGACIKIINSGSNLNLTFSGLVYINGINYFNTTFTSNEICYIELRNYFAGNGWMITTLTPRLFYPTTSKYIYYNVSDLDNLRNVNITSPTNGQVLKYNSTSSKWENNTDSNTGLTSVGLSMPSIFSTSNSPLIANGTIAVSFNAQSGNKFLASSLANDGTVLFRTISSADIPTLPYLTSFNSRTGPVISPAEGDYTLNLLGDVTITTPANAETLIYNGTNFVNTKRVDVFQFNSDGNLANGQYLYPGFSQNANEQRTQTLLAYNIVITEMNIFLSAAPGTGNSRLFTVRTNGNIQATITIANLATTKTQAINVACSAGQLLSVQNISSGAAAALGILNLKYYYA